MRRSVVSVLAVFGVTVLCARPVSAQGGTNTAITRAAVQAVTSELHTGERLPHGRIGFDSRVLERHPAPESGPDAMAYVLGSTAHPDTVIASLGADRADFERSVVCATSSPRSCRLPDVVAVLAASEPVQTGSAAEVVVAARWRSELAKMPVGYTRYVVTLARSASGEWVACRIRTELIS